MEKDHNQLNVSNFPNVLRKKLEHLRIEQGIKLNKLIIHILWEYIKKNNEEK